ncbi:Hypothetical predicted protein, partial [Mytilus galloprovincialis]
MSGKVTTNAVITYGTVTVRAIIPKGDWLWPAIWMLPRDWHYGGWPRSGEIDIMESRVKIAGTIGDIDLCVNFCRLNSIISKNQWKKVSYQHRYVHYCIFCTSRN